MAYTVLADALARAKERCQGKATAADDAWLTEILGFSAGTVGGVTHYRPYYCAAKLLEQKQSVQGLSEAEGVKFTGLTLPIASLLALQQAYDLAFALEIPAGFEVPTASRATRSIAPTVQP